MKQYLAEYKINGKVLDEILIIADSFKEAEQKLILQNKDNPLKYKLIGQLLKHV